jgi:hypothetical protein
LITLAGIAIDTMGTFFMAIHPANISKRSNSTLQFGLAINISLNQQRRRPRIKLKPDFALRAGQQNEPL